VEIASGCAAMERKRVDATGATASSGGTAGSASAAEQSAAEYLERHSVTLLMHDLLAVLLENRPAEPIDFISDYFDHVVQGDGGEPIERCCRYIRLSKPGKRTDHSRSRSPACAAGTPPLAPLGTACSPPAICTTYILRLNARLCVQAPSRSWTILPPPTPPSTCTKA
jgi:hypothetical protein